MSEEPKDEPNPYAPPADAPPEKRKKKKRKARAEKPCEMLGEVMLVPRDVELPLVCMKCGGDGGDVVHVKKKFQWTPQWARFLVMCGGIGAIVMLVTTKRAELMIPLCPLCAKRWQLATTLLIVAVVALVGSIFAIRLPDDPTQGFVFLVIALVGLIVVSRMMRPRTLQPDLIDVTHVHLKGVHENACREMCP